MAARKYYGRKSAASSAGEQPPEAAPVDERRPVDAEPPPSSPAPEQKAAGPVSGLGAQLQAMRAHAAPPPPDPIDAFINAYYPGAHPHERQWLRANPHYLQQDPALVHAAGRIALDRGIPRQSPEFLHAIAALIDQHHAAMQAPQPTPSQPQPSPMPPPPLPEPPPMPAPPHVARVDIEEHDDEQIGHRVSAPPSRDYAHAAVDPDTIPGRITLTPAEREIANLPGGPGEAEYAKQKLRLMKQKKAGFHND